MTGYRPLGTAGSLGPERVWVPAAVFARESGTATLISATSRPPYWSCPDASTTVLIASVQPPPEWSTFTIEERLFNLHTSSGDVRLDRRHEYGHENGYVLNSGDNRTILPLVTRTVTTQNAIATFDNTDTVLTASGLALVYFRRSGSDAADTLAGALGFLGFMLKRVS